MVKAFLGFISGATSAARTLLAVLLGSLGCALAEQALFDVGQVGLLEVHGERAVALTGDFFTVDG